MRLEQLTQRELCIPFTTTFRHASAERRETASIWVEARAEGLAGFGESCPRPYVTGETNESARDFFAAYQESWRRDIVDLDSLREWMATHTVVIDRNPAAWCAVELALLDLLGKVSGQTVESLLSLPALSGPFRYTAVLGDSHEAGFDAMAHAYQRMGFTDFKVKLSGDLERDRRKLAVLESIDSTFRLRVDANNLWPEVRVALTHLRNLGRSLAGVEEPLTSGQFAELSLLSGALGYPIILDESVISIDQLRLLEGPADRWVVNVRVSKMGGLLRSLGVVSAARARGIPVIVGAQVGETSLLTRAALTVAQVAGSDLLAQEGAFGTFLLEHDVCEPPVMFGAGGTLDPRSYPFDTLGFGLPIATGPYGANGKPPKNT
jgi:L-alanine-DL-glutamate epimerase-like enolase superfamily enzyme